MQTSSKPPGALPAVSAIKSYDWKIPATLGVPIGTIMSRLFPGKAQLRYALAKAFVPAVGAMPTGGVQPRNADPVVLAQVGHAGTDGRHVPHALMARDERQGRLHQQRPKRMRTAPACQHLHNQSLDHRLKEVPASSQISDRLNQFIHQPVQTFILVRASFRLRTELLATT
jgi:hypothetical protein